MSEEKKPLHITDETMDDIYKSVSVKNAIEFSKGDFKFGAALTCFSALVYAKFTEKLNEKKEKITKTNNEDMAEMFANIAANECAEAAGDEFMLGMLLSVFIGQVYKEFEDELLKEEG